MMKTILKKDEATLLGISSPFRILELTIHRKDRTRNLAKVKIHFSNISAELEKLDFSSDTVFSLTLKAMSMSKHTYTGDSGAIVKEVYKYAKVTFSEPINIEDDIDIYWSEA